MKKAKDMIIQESITLPAEVRDREAVAIQISFLFSDGSMHHVKPKGVISRRLASDCLKMQRTRYENWSFLNAEDTEV